MSLTLINQTIRMVCQDIEAHNSLFLNWMQMDEEELLYEAAICIFGSQLLFEMAVATADRLCAMNLIRVGLQGMKAKTLEQKISNALSNPLQVMDNKGMIRWVRPRFKNRLASLLTATIVDIYEQSKTIRGLLLAARSAKSARKLLTHHVWGFGPKQASLFLRRVGYCADLAVLDAHVLGYLRLAHGLSFSSGKLGNLSFYEKIENTFRHIAADFGHSLGCVDLAIWLTMRVAKREALL